MAQGYSGYAFRFQRTLENSEFVLDEYQFEGFELYYRFYAGSLPNESITDLTGLLANGFKRVSGNDDPPTWDGKDSPRPLIAVDWDDPNVINFTLDFAASDEPTVSNDQDSTLIVMRRQPTYDSLHPLADQFKSFLYDLVPGDPSYAASDSDVVAASGLWDAIQARDDVTLTLYVLSYGTQDYITPLYSDAVCLSSITVGTNPFGW